MLQVSATFASLLWLPVLHSSVGWLVGRLFAENAKILLCYLYYNNNIHRKLLLSFAYNGNAAVHMDSCEKKLQTHRIACARSAKSFHIQTHTHTACEFEMKLSFFCKRARTHTHCIYLHFNLLNVNFFSIMLHNLFVKNIFAWQMPFRRRRRRRRL